MLGIIGSNILFAQEASEGNRVKGTFLRSYASGFQGSFSQAMFIKMRNQAVHSEDALDGVVNHFTFSKHGFSP